MEQLDASSEYQLTLSEEFGSLSELCRICLNVADENCVSMHSSYLWSGTEIRSTHSMIEMLLNIQLYCQNKDGEPQKICSKCLNQINLMFAFRNQCIESNKTIVELHKQLESQSDIMIEDIQSIPATNNITYESITPPVEQNRDVNIEATTSVATKPRDSIFIIYKNPFTNASNYQSIESNSEDATSEKPNNRVIGAKNVNNLNEIVTDLCPLCGESFDSPRDFVRHMCSKHGKGINPQTFICQFCDTGFTTKDELEVHSKVHTNKQHFICDVCGKICFNKVNILIHLKYHFGIKAYECSVCKHRFVRGLELKKHINRKHSANLLKCTYQNCTETFNSKYYLNIHLRIHDTGHAFVCDVCGVATVSEIRLSEHKTIHTGEKKRKCPVCDKMLSNQRKVILHLRSMHKSYSYSQLYA